MDYYALSELVILSLVGLSILTVAVGFSVRMFVAPTLREILGRNDESDPREKALLVARIDAIEERLEGIEGGLGRLADAAEFDRQLEGPK